MRKPVYLIARINDLGQPLEYLARQLTDRLWTDGPDPALAWRIRNLGDAARTAGQWRDWQAVKGYGMNFGVVMEEQLPTGAFRYTLLPD